MKKVCYILATIVFISVYFLCSCRKTGSNSKFEDNNAAQPSVAMEMITTVVPTETAEITAEIASINYDAVQEIIRLGTSTTVNNLNLREDIHLKGIFKNGNVLYTSDGKSLFRYEANQSKFTLSESIPLYTDTEMICAGISDDGLIIKGMDILTYDKKSSFSPRMTNANNSIAFIQINSQNGLQHRNYQFNEKANKVTEIIPNHILETFLTDEQKGLTTWVSLISLPNENILYHVFVKDNYVDNMTSYWIVQDRKDNILSNFQTRYFDNITNVHVNLESRYLVFSYSQTPGYPQLLDLENQKVYSIFEKDSEFYNSTIDFISWINSEKICVGIVDSDRTITMVSVDNVINK